MNVFLASENNEFEQNEFEMDPNCCQNYSMWKKNGNNVANNGECSGKFLDWFETKFLYSPTVLHEIWMICLSQFYERPLLDIFERTTNTCTTGILRWNNVMTLVNTKCNWSCENITKGGLIW